MDAEQYQREFEIFQRCLELAASERAAELDEACGSDAEQRARIGDLLAAASSTAADAVSDRQIEARESARWFGGLTSFPRGDAPESIGPYRIVRLIGEGGMGQVFEGEQQTPKRRVAVKLVAPRAQSSVLAQRFELETDVLARLQHPGIAQIFECGEHDGEHGPQPYFAMELVDGVDVRTYAERAELDVSAKLALVAEIADAIEHAHTKGVVHRDLKPDNVLVGESGHPKVLDFGIARVTDDSTLMRTAVTETGQLIGTLNYMAPEQLGGDSTRIDARADVYALGVILFELLSGRRPHEVSGLALTAAIRIVAEEEAPRLGRFVPAIARDVETIVGKALEKDADRRYATAGTLAGDLRRFLAHEPITARPPSAVYVARRFAQRHRGLVVGSTLALIAIGVGFAGVVASERRETIARENAERMGIDALASSYQATHATLERGEIWSARDQLDRVGTEHRGWEWRWLDARAPLLLDGLHSWHVAFQGHYVAAAAEAGGKEAIRPLVIVDLMYPEERTIVEGLDGAFAPVNSGGGPALIQTRTPGETKTGYHAVTGIVDLPTASILEFNVHEVHADLNLHNHVGPTSMTADGLLAEAYIDRDSAGKGISRCWVSTREERAAGIPTRRSPTYEGWVRPQLTPDGALALLTSSLKNQTRIVSTDDWSDVAILDLDDKIACDLDRRGERVARLSDGGLLEILEVPSLDVLRRFELPDGSADSLRWIRNDEWLWVEVGKHKLILDAEDGTIVERLDNGAVHGLSGIATDGRYIALIGGRRNLPWIHELGVAEPTPYRELRGHTSWIYHVAYSPDGSLIASAAPEDPLVRLWDGWTGEPLACLQRALSPPRKYLNFEVPLIFTDDGRTLVTTAPGPDGIAVRTYDSCTGASKSFEPGGWAARNRDVESVLGDLAGRRLSGGLVGHPDGDQVFRSAPSTREHHPLRLDPIGDGETREIGQAQGIALSPNGELLAVGEIGGFRLVRPSSLETVSSHQVGGNLARYYALAWSPDGQRLALGEEQGHITILETQYFRPIIDLPDHDGYVYSMVWSPDGTRLVTASGDTTLRIHDTLHGIPWRLRAEARAQRVEHQRARLETLVNELGSLTDAVDALLAEVESDEDAAMAARRACLLHWTRARGAGGR